MDSTYRTFTRVVFISVTLLFVTAYSEGSDPFTVPSVLEDNVAFWKMIYSEVPLTDGLFHDREYPLVIYKRATVGKRRGSTRRAFLRKHIKGIKSTLHAIATKPAEQLNADQKRIKKLLELYIPEDERATAPSRIRFQQGQKQRFLGGLERSGMYIDTIRAVLKSYGVPLRLAYLPHVESSFDVSAYSKVGAAGMWQFMRGTGRAFGLDCNYLVDERRDPYLATDAAARLLAHNYSKLQSWPLAITAYNHGLAGMQRAVAQTGSRDIAVIIERHTSRSFKFASKNFYGCFLAASEIAENAEDYFGTIAYHEPLTCSDISLTHYVSPKVLSTYVGVSEQLLRKLNPALRPVVFQHDKKLPKGYVLRLPNSVSPEAAMVAISSIPDSLRSDEPERPNYYRVQRGDNLYGIASRLGVSARSIALENDITRMNRIYEGQVLRIPGGKGSSATPPIVALAKPSENEETETAEAPTETEEPETTPRPSAPRPTAEPVAIPSRPGAADRAAPEQETARPAASVATPDSLDAIMMATADTVTPTSPRSRPSAMSRFDVDVYNLETMLTSPGMAEIRVAVDETIGHYAEWLDIPTWRVRQLNSMRGRSSIRVGQRLLIPLSREDALEQFAKVRLEYHMVLEEDFYMRYKVVDVKSKRVRRGENLWDICTAEGEIPLWLFKKHNPNLDLNRLMPGTVVWLPVVDEKTEEDLALEQLEDSGTYPSFRIPVRPRAAPAGLLP